MSFEAAAWAIKQNPVSAREKLILIVMADCHNKETKVCNPSLQYLCKHAMISKSTLFRCLDSLERQGYFTRDRGNISTRTQYNLRLGRSITDLGPLQTQVGSDTGVGPPQTQGRSTTLPQTSNKPGKEPGSTCAPFELFWLTYPKKKSKGAAEKAWKKLSTQDQQHVIRDLSRRVGQDPDWLKDSGQFIPYPATYLNRQGWLDDWVPPSKAMAPELEAI